jgi:DNA polymerase III delta subunit
MLYVFHGTDTRKVADKANAVIVGLKKKRPDVQVFVFEGALTDVAPLDELIEARGLFVEKHIVVLRQPFETEESASHVLERIERIATSENIFILVEGKILAERKRNLEKHAAQAEEHSREAQKKENTGFALSDALGARDRRALWTEYVLGLRSGSEPEVLHGTLAWAARGMILASRYASADEAGLNSFVYSKFKRFAQNYTEEERLELSHQLLALYHEARWGKHDLATATERWTLTV